MQKRILLVEDDHDIHQLIESQLQQDHYHVDSARDGEEAVALFHSGKFDLILLDLMLPKINGMDLLRHFRESSKVPVLIISAKGSDLDKAMGLGFGADDYISKPFSMIELTARVQAAIRRATLYAETDSKSAEPPVISFKDLILDLHSFSVKVRGHHVPLTSKEFHILKLLMTNHSRVFTKEQIYQFIWEDDYYGNENVINVHIRRLREKIEEDPSTPQYIRTIWGIGYKMGD
ncbi:DNA-binding response regulator [Paenibacillus glucanolyticus]|uniref:response regulator transcription factor n=1 Tax=Paenibacillus TaxID=44249 RepID=UPI0003E2C4D2|nr:MULTISPECIES: response regulator transcription factor [Paenibacillus]AVV58304.1 DNA-binding response regulator [Paenibacillus glucanolyticus]AWP27466.1 DNA-binding response regulator [Paenibacillus sp. Cedars]ETT42518.1 winged helix family two component transcriptional regulator [Paenibacillus sp. FSL R5-808]MDH6670846.1 DNA-binding response OmpR family regulator [Paenibacillus sp. LBL]MPY17612.1 response regulator transcription factor [Paenibacillus glucanolyticus]